MSFKKAFAFIFILFLSHAYAKEIEVNNKLTVNNIDNNTTMSVQDPIYSDYNSWINSTSVDPAVYVHLKLEDDYTNTATRQTVFSCMVSFVVTWYPLQQNAQPVVTQTQTLIIKHDYTSEIYASLVDYAVLKIPGAHKATLSSIKVRYFDAAGQEMTNYSSSAVSLNLQFKATRYYNIADTNLSLNSKLVTYNGMTPVETSGDIASGQDELKLVWSVNTTAPPEFYEIEWTWVDNYSDSATASAPSQITLTEQEFMRNSTRVETSSLSYNIPLIYNNGYLIYRIRPVGRFLDNYSKFYFGPWSSGSGNKISVADWPNILRINSPHEAGNKNWQFQSSYAEQGKKKEVISYFDGTLRNRQTVTRINSTKQSVVGEVIYDNQGRPAIEVLPVPLNQGAIHFYDKLNRNSANQLFTHRDFDWEDANTIVCNPVLSSGFSTVAGASNYYSAQSAASGAVLGNFLPDAETYPFSQTEYTPDNTGRISRKGGVGAKHQLGSAHEMKYFYSSPKSNAELDRLFGYKVGYFNRYKKNVVIDPNKQISISYVDAQGRTVATALAGESPEKLTALEDTQNSSLHAAVTYDFSAANTPYSTGRNGLINDGMMINSQVLNIQESGLIKFDYNFHTTDAYTDPCISQLNYPFTFDWSVSLRDECGNEKFSAPANLGTLATSKEFHQDVSQLSIGTYTLKKDIVVNQAKLEEYADNYIERLQQKTDDNSCYLNKDNFKPVASFSGCHTTCNDCEINFVTQYLNSTDATTYKTFFGDNPNLLGDVGQRQPLADRAMKKYIEVHLSDLYGVNITINGNNQPVYDDNEGSINAAEVMLYINRFKQEFSGLIGKCRDLCKKSSATNICSVNEKMLLADFKAPSGQYASNDANDPVSVLNVNNKFLLEGTVVVNGQTVSKYSWKNPAVPYADDLGTPMWVQVTKLGSGSYDPPINANPNEIIPIEGDPVHFKVAPQKLQNVSDFISMFKPSWARSFLPYHPEYYYYLYSENLCETTSTGGNSTYSFDGILQDAEFEDIYEGVQGISFAVIKSRSADPYFNGTIYPNNLEDTAIRAQRTAIMNYALTEQYDGHTFNSKPMDMLDTAVYYTVFPNGTMSSTEQSNFTQALQNDEFQQLFSASEDPSQTSIFQGVSITPTQKKQIWRQFSIFYTGLKTKIINLYSHIYSAQHGRFNGCIGNAENNNTFVSLFQPYPNYSAISSSLNAALEGINNNAASVCGADNAAYFADKEKRFPDSDYGVNSGSPDSAASAASDAEAGYFLQTGRCPQAAYLEGFLHGLLLPQYHTAGWKPSQLPAGSLPYLVPPIQTALNQTSSGAEINYSINQQFLSLTVGSAEVVKLQIASFETGCSLPLPGPDWSMYGSTGFSIKDIKNLTYTPGSYNIQNNTYEFDAIMIVQRAGSQSPCELPLEEVLIHGITHLPIGECSFAENPSGVPGSTVLDSDSATGTTDGCNKRTRFENGLAMVMTRLLDHDALYGTPQPLQSVVNPQTGLLTDTFGYSASILPEVLNAPSATWQANGQNLFTITSGATTVALIQLNESLPSAENIDKFTAVEITDAQNGPVIIKITYLTITGSLVTITGNIWRNSGHEPLSFECVCTEMQDITTGAQTAFLQLLKHVWSRRNYYAGLQTPITPQPYMSNVAPFLSINSPSINNFNIQAVDPVSGEKLQQIEFKFASQSCKFHLPLSNTRSKLFQHITGFSNLKIIGITADNTIEFSVFVHHSRFTEASVVYPAGFVVKYGTIECANLACAQFTVAQSRLKDLILAMINDARNGDIPQVYSSAAVNEMFPFIISEDTWSAPLQLTGVAVQGGDTGSQLRFTFGNTGCDVILDLPNATFSEISTITEFALNSDLKHFIVKGLLQGGGEFKASGTIGCLSVVACQREVQVPCQKCIPQLPSPVTCGSGWQLYKALPEAILTYNDFDTSEFCSANLQYVVNDYIYYLQKFQVLAAEFPLQHNKFLTISQFAMNSLGYGNMFTQHAIDQYYSYSVANPDINWLEYVRGIYLSQYEICPVPAMLPGKSALEISLPDACEVAQQAIVGTYSEAFWQAYLFAQRNAFKERYINAAMSMLNERVKASMQDKEYQYTLYYYDQAGNLVQTVPPQGVNRLPADDTRAAAIAAARDANTTNPAILPDHKLQTKYKYNTLNQLTWQFTPDGGVTKFAYDFKGRIIASQNERQLTSYYGLPPLTLSNGLVLDGGVIIRTQASGTPIKGSCQLTLPGNCFVEYTIYNNNNGIVEDNLGASNGKVRVGMSYTDNADPAHINFGSIINNESSINEPLRRIVNGVIETATQGQPPTFSLAANSTNVVRLERKNTHFVWTVNGVAFGNPVSDPNPTQPMFVDFAIAKANATIRNLTVGINNNGDRYSYTRYDDLGRITEAGEIYPSGDALATPTYVIRDGELRLRSNPASPLPKIPDNNNDPSTGIEGFPSNSRRTEVTRTIYDEPFGTSASLFTDYGNNSRNRVTAVLYYDNLSTAASEANYNNAIFYDYDVHGNVKELVHENNDPSLAGIDKHIKKISYEYDLISGNVNKVTYQPGQLDQFIHRYTYDDDNRILSAETSKDNIIWEKDAAYQYYQHGPLARVELGDKKVQGLDYIYTLQGWLKAVNGEIANRDNDAGGDGLTVAKDAFGFALNYYSGDYKARGGSAFDSRIRSLSVGETAEGVKDLYNGNIKEMVTSMLTHDQKPLPTQFNKYTYDQLNRITGMTSTGYFYNTDFGNINARTVSYATDYTYDKNGNLKTMRRNFPTSVSGSGTSERYDMRDIDQFTYNYYPGTNRLRYITDTSSFNDPNYGDIMASENRPYNYKYDAAGQLIRDFGEGLTIDWRADGKVKSVTQANNDVISFGYDGLGTRIYKKVNKTDGTVTTTYYERDAQGNPMATYEMNEVPGQTPVYRLLERSIYGSSRLGLERAEMVLHPEPGTAQRGATATGGMTAKLAGEPIEPVSIQKVEGGLLVPLLGNVTWENVEDEPAVNFYDNVNVPMTKKIEMRTHIKIIATALLPGNRNSIATLQGKTAGDWGDGTLRETQCSFHLLVERGADGKFIPVIMQEMFNHHQFDHKKGLDHEYWISSITYKLPQGITSNEWDLELKMVLNQATGNYLPKLTINGNVYTQFEKVVTDEHYERWRNDNMGLEPIANAIGYKKVLHMEHSESHINDIEYKAVPMYICDFEYEVDALKRTFRFDSPGASYNNLLASPENKIYWSDDTVKPDHFFTQFSVNYCGNANQDSDGDGINNGRMVNGVYEKLDNCPFVYNPLQEDADGDGVGDVCDNCMYKNPDQEDADLDGVGDGGIGVDDLYHACDNCKLTFNPEQGDADNDGIGNACDKCKYDPDNDCEGDDQGDGTSLPVIASAGTYTNNVGDKRYELSNHLGNVLSVITDRKLIGGNAVEGAPLYNFTFEGTTHGFAATSTGTAPTVDNGRLALTATANNGGAQKDILLAPGKTYRVSFDVARGSYAPTLTADMTYAIGITVSLSGSITTSSSGHQSFTVTLPADIPANLDHQLRFRLRQGDYTGWPHSFYIDNITVSELTSTLVTGLQPDVVEYHDYDPLGMLINQRTRSESGGYRYGFNGKEKDNELKGEGNSYDYTKRFHDPRIGRFLSIDPLEKQFPWYTPYQFAGNTPIQAIDLDGAEEFHYTRITDKSGNTTGLKFIKAVDIHEWQWKPQKDNSTFLGFALWESVKNPRKEFVVHQTDSKSIDDGGVNVTWVDYDESVTFDSYSQARHAKTSDFASTAEDWIHRSLQGVNNAAAETRSNGGPYTVGQRINVKDEKWSGPLNYSDLKEPRNVGPGLETTVAQRKRILEYNRTQNGGVIRSDDDGQILDLPVKIPRGGKANMNQAEVDHIEERVEGGTNSNKNQRVISKRQNLDKEVKRRKSKG